MKSTLPISFAALSVFAALGLPYQLSAQTQAPRYTVIDLGTFGGPGASAYGVNQEGRAAGAASLPNGDQHAFLTGIGGTKFDLGTLGGPNSAANGINAGAALAIESETAAKDPFGNDFCAFGTNRICLPAVWNGTLTALPTLGGNNGAALAINNQGLISGFAETSVKDSACPAPQTLQYQAVVWGPNPGQVQALPPLSGDTVGFTFAAANGRGQVVGSSGTCDNTPLFPFPAGPHPVLWDNGKAISLGNLGGANLGVGVGINDAGVIVGGSDLPSELPGFPFVQVHCTLWSGSGMEDLGAVEKDFSSLPTWINNRNQVVGASCDDQGNCRGFLWQNHQMVDLNSLIPADSPLYLVFPESINDAGQIVGMAVNTSTGDSRAFLATPTRATAAIEDFTPEEMHASAIVPMSESVRKVLRGHKWMGRR